jgi:hypothetical protein
MRMRSQLAAFQSSGGVGDGEWERLGHWEPNLLSTIHYSLIAQTPANTSTKLVAHENSLSIYRL